ncbi:TIGR01777 family protein [Rhodohalobacter sp. SW132]|uniref:TIGR01777 family oxidoreductase n=1 Tax=Rhodohalobacter sp. SW132 TaxID=2293433 RepID=UPI000E25EA91|nr:TIGR01777 family oxidoreductase [Rhodohalobacter sp. SW132]REL24573.1 TIGR01777 family protein [Rhodohalobacter sp. SW132]
MNNEKQILITGGTGFIGSYLGEDLMRDGHYLTLITRSPEKYAEQSAQNHRYIGWDDNLAAEMEKADVVINLAGENLFGKRWTDEVKKRLYNSRIDLTKKLVDAMGKASNPPSLFISASGINYYGDSGDKVLTEESPAGNDFLAKLCVDWEAEALKAEQHNVRVAIPRISPALEDDGGMIEQMKLPFKMFVGGPLGRGTQYLSWIHMNDLCSSILFPMKKPEFSGPYNACSPNPVTMRELATAMGNVLKRPSLFKVPEFALNTVLGEAATPVLSSVRAQPKRLQQAGFEFEYEDLDYALADIL